MLFPDEICNTVFYYHTKRQLLSIEIEVKGYKWSFTNGMKWSGVE